MDPTKLIAVSLSSLDRKCLEQTAELVEGMARALPVDATVTDQGNNEIRVRDWLMSRAWDMKQTARWGTPEFGK